MPVLLVKRKLSLKETGFARSQPWECKIKMYIWGWNRSCAGVGVVVGAEQVALDSRRILYKGKENGEKVTLPRLPEFCRSGSCFPGGSDGKESARNARDLGSIPGLVRCPGGGGMATHSTILAWRIPMDRWARRAVAHGIAESDTTERLSAAQKPTEEETSFSDRHVSWRLSKITVSDWWDWRGWVSLIG